MKRFSPVNPEAENSKLKETGQPSIFSGCGMVIYFLGGSAVRKSRHRHPLAGVEEYESSHKDHT